MDKQNQDIYLVKIYFDSAYQGAQAFQSKNSAESYVKEDKQACGEGNEYIVERVTLWAN